MRFRDMFDEAVRRVRGEHGRYFLLDRMPDEAVCAEIGVWRGEFSRQILKYTNPETLYLIDPWEYQPEFPDRQYGGAVADEQMEMDGMYRTVHRRFGGRNDVEILRKYSREALAIFEDDALDWVYIDGNHFYEYVKRDLEMSLEKVRPGGFVTGDDYEWGDEHDYPVKRAVNEIVAEEDVVVETVWNDQYVLRNGGG
ncbi:MAG: class I SAM-dependent methyltransferase [Bradymonadaceae bacterium]